MKKITSLFTSLFVWIFINNLHADTTSKGKLAKIWEIKTGTIKFIEPDTNGNLYGLLLSENETISQVKISSNGEILKVEKLTNVLFNYLGNQFKSYLTWDDLYVSSTGWICGANEKGWLEIAPDKVETYYYFLPSEYTSPIANEFYTEKMKLISASYGTVYHSKKTIFKNVLSGKYTEEEKIIANYYDNEYKTNSVVLSNSSFFTKKILDSSDYFSIDRIAIFSSEGVTVLGGKLEKIYQGNPLGFDYDKIISMGDRSAAKSDIVCKINSENVICIQYPMYDSINNRLKDRAIQIGSNGTLVVDVQVLPESFYEHGPDFWYNKIEIFRKEGGWIIPALARLGYFYAWKKGYDSNSRLVFFDESGVVKEYELPETLDSSSKVFVGNDGFLYTRSEGILSKYSLDLVRYTGKR